MTGAARGLDVPHAAILCVAAAMLAYNTVLHYIAGHLRAKPVKREWSNTHPFARLLVPRTFLGFGDEGRLARAALFAFVQITLDYLSLAALVHFCGGVESPLSVFFVFHVVIASILLSRRGTYLQTTVGFLLFAAVALGECFGLLDHHALGLFWLPHAYRTGSAVASGLAVFGATLYLASYLCSTIAVDLRERVRANVRLSRQIAEDKKQLERAYETVRESERTKSQYMRKVAHELRGPLGTIETALKVILQGLAGAPDEPTRDLLARAQRRAGELAAVTQDLLLLARAREAGLEPEQAPVALEGLIHEIVRDFKPSAERKDVSISAEAASGGVVLGDAVAVRQLIANLVENGIRYTPPGGAVVVTLHRGDGRLVLEVRDTGIGIASEDLTRIFDEFYRAPNARQYAEQGTGLGLTIVKQTAERLGAVVTVKSRLGAGTQFVVTLPANDSGPERAGPRPAH